MDVKALDPDLAFCPYAGLDSYEAVLRPYFFGREGDTALIVSNVYASNLTVLYGPSAVGKSSILQAGVIPSSKKAERPSSFVANGNNPRC
jgi:putative ribosome biogenesis GTPase RsgA